MTVPQVAGKRLNRVQLWPRRFIVSVHGVASHTTIGVIFRRLQPGRFFTKRRRNRIQKQTWFGREDS